MKSFVLNGRARKFFLGAILMLALLLLFGRAALAIHYTGCVVPADCVPYPPAGATCEILYNQGSNAGNNGFVPDPSACAYVDSQGPSQGWPCGGATFDNHNLCNP